MSIELEYAVKKDIPNRAVVREADARQRAELRSMLLLAAVVVGMLLFSAWQHHAMFDARVRVERLRAAYPDLGEEELEPVYYREALRWIVEHPVDWIVLELRKAFYLIVPAGPSYTLHSPRYLAASVLSYLTVLALGGLGIVRCRRDLGRLQGLWLLVGSSVLVALVFFPQERFRIPIIDPALVILAGAGLATFRQPPRA